ncbi:MAG TPA: phage holin family protein [Candidatus Methanoperedens sp.]|nr:phage holin family protein [Candidatus Methanoperedens sp.]
MHFVLRAAIAAFGLWLATRVVPGIRIDSAGTLAGAALLLGVVNAIVKPVVLVLSLPFLILTLGLFYFVVNAALFGLVAWALSGFHVDGFVAALLGSLVVSVICWLGSAFTKD